MATRGGIKGRSVEARVNEVVGFQGESEARVVEFRFTDERGLVYDPPGRGQVFGSTRMVPIEIAVRLTVWRDEWPGDRWPPAPGDRVPVALGYGLLVRKEGDDAVREPVGADLPGDGAGPGPDATGAG